ncbi:hypothetical protein U0070_015224, partial [Myodes glareolus]
LLALIKAKTAEVMRLLQTEPSCESCQSSALLTSGKKKGAKEDGRGGWGDFQVRVFSLNLDYYGSGAVCKEATAGMQLLPPFGGRGSAQLSEKPAWECRGCCVRANRQRRSIMFHSFTLPQGTPGCQWPEAGEEKATEQQINGQLVALKVISMNAEEGVPFTAIREVLRG